MYLCNYINLGIIIEHTFMLDCITVIYFILLFHKICNRGNSVVIGFKNLINIVMLTTILLICFTVVYITYLASSNVQTS